MRLGKTRMARTRTLIAASALVVPAALLTVPAQARDAVTRTIVEVNFDYQPGSIVIDTAKKDLYYALGSGHAIKYKVAVGKRGFEWYGQSFVQKKKKDPGWSPTARMRRMGAPRYVPPGPRNPLGIRAIYLGWTEYRIHGTNAPSSIGRAASSGCIRMHNKDVADLFERIHIGAPVYVVKKLEIAQPKQQAALKH